MKKQKHLFKPSTTAYGGALYKTRKGRSRPRPLAVRSSMHLVLRSSKAQGAWSFKNKTHSRNIDKILNKFSLKHRVKILMFANVGSHLHLHIQLMHRQAYKPFIRAITAAITMTVTGASRWKPLATLCTGKFWDLRPFTRVVQGYKDFLNLKNYIELNELEGCGYTRAQAKYLLAREWDLAHSTE